MADLHLFLTGIGDSKLEGDRFFASAGHGYLPPMGVAILAIFLSQIIAVAGWGETFPWSIPALYSQGDDLGAISFEIVGVTGVIGIVATLLWWEMADQTQ